MSDIDKAPDTLDYTEAEVKDLDYTIIGSGSTGNAVRIGNIMIDCGMPFNAMRDELYKCNTLLITHIHTDHIKDSTFRKILSEFPRIKTFSNPTVAYKYHINEVISSTPFLTPSGIEITPYIGSHDTEVSYFSWALDGQEILYATDTCIVENPNGIKYDWLFLESNYDEQKLNAMAKQYANRHYDPWVSSHRHLSTQQSKAFYYTNRRGPESHWVELHKSGRFY